MYEYTTAIHRITEENHKQLQGNPKPTPILVLKRDKEGRRLPHERQCQTRDRFHSGIKTSITQLTLSRTLCMRLQPNTTLQGNRHSVNTHAHTQTPKSSQIRSCRLEESSSSTVLSPTSQDLRRIQNTYINETTSRTPRKRGKQLVTRGSSADTKPGCRRWTAGCNRRCRRLPARTRGASLPSR